MTLGGAAKKNCSTCRDKEVKTYKVYLFSKINVKKITICDKDVKLRYFQTFSCKDYCYKTIHLKKKCCAQSSVDSKQGISANVS